MAKDIYKYQAKYQKEKVISISIKYPRSAREYNALEWAAQKAGRPRAEYMRRAITAAVIADLQAHGLTLDSCPLVVTDHQDQLPSGD